MNADKLLDMAITESIQGEFRRVLWTSLTDSDLLLCLDTKRRATIKRLLFCDKGAGSGSALDVLIAHFAAAIEKDIVLSAALDRAEMGLPC